MSEPTRQGVEVGRSPATQHPQWCSPRCCINTGAETEHASKPSTLLTTDEIWEGSLVRCDEHAFPGEVGGMHLRIDVTNTALVDHDAQHVVTVEDLPRIARWLMVEYERAVFCSAPSVVAS